MELRQLRYFVAAAEEQNFRRAAERLNVVQPAVSRQIALLEEELGAALFLRRKRRVALSPAGRSLLADVRWLLRELQLAGERARRVAGGSEGLLRVGFHQAAGRATAVLKAIQTFRSTFPGIELQLVPMTSPTQLDGIVHDEIDAGFVYLPERLPPRFQFRMVEQDRFHLAMRTEHPLAAQVSVSLAALDGLPLVSISRNTNPDFYDSLYGACEARGVRPRIVQETQEETTIMHLVAVGMGVALVSSADARSWHPDVVLRPVADLDVVKSLALVWKEECRQPLLEALLSCIAGEGGI